MNINLLRNPYFLADQKRMLKRWYVAPQIHRLGGKIPPAKPGEIRLFMMVRNEMLRLPYMLKRHFELGVDRAIVLDNESDDGTREWLLQQKDVHVLTTRDSYVRTETWLDVIMRWYGRNTWCLMLDADEMIMYPEVDRADLRQLTRYLDQHKYTAISTALVDMYDTKSTDRVGYQAGEPFLDYCRHFDAPDYEQQPFIFRGGEHPYPYRLCGGPRRRIFGEQTCCTNFPLVKFESRMFVRAGRHAVEFARVAPLRGALFHFKYFQDFGPKAKVEASRGVHYDGAKHYKLYAGHLANEGGLSLYGAQSVRYTDLQQLGRMGVMINDPDWIAFAGSL